MVVRAALICVGAALLAAGLVTAVDLTGVMQLM